MLLCSLLHHQSHLRAEIVVDAFGLALWDPWQRPTKRHDFSSWDLDPRPTHWTPRKVFQCYEIFSFCAAPPRYHWTLCPLSEYRRYAQSPIREAPSRYRPGSNLGEVGLLPVKLEPNVVSANCLHRLWRHRDLLHGSVAPNEVGIGNPLSNAQNPDITFH